MVRLHYSSSLTAQAVALTPEALVVWLPRRRPRSGRRSLGSVIHHRGLLVALEAPLVDHISHDGTKYQGDGGKQHDGRLEVIATNGVPQLLAIAVVLMTVDEEWNAGVYAPVDDTNQVEGAVKEAHETPKEDDL